MAGMRYQPQGLARLDRRNKFAANAQAIMLASQSVNLTSGKLLVGAGSGRMKQVFPVGQAWSFRKNFYVETEVLPAIGTGAFVEFWIGYPSIDVYAKGSTNEPGFVTGSSANQFGIYATGGVGHTGIRWGCVNNWGSNTFYDAGEGLTLGVLTVLLVYRYGTTLELWRNGQMIQRFTGITPTSLPAQTLICGSFVEDTGYWPSSSDTVMAGRVPMPAPVTADEIRQFSANPWQIFEAPEDDEFAVAAAGADANVSPQGVSAVASIGLASASAGSRATPAGVTAKTSVGSASASAGAGAIGAPAGVAASGAVGSPVAAGGAQAAPSGNAAIGLVGVLTESAGANASPSGVAVAAQAGAAAATGGSASTAAPAGVSAAASIGQSTARGGASVLAQGVAASVAIGQASASAGIGRAVAVVGVGAVAGVGVATGSGGARCATAGVGATTSVGAVIAAGNIAVSGMALPAGVAAYARVGIAIATGGGSFARAPAGPGYASHQHYNERRPAAIQRNNR